MCKDYVDHAGLLVNNVFNAERLNTTFRIQVHTELDR